MDLKELKARLKQIGQEAQAATGETLDKLMAEANDINSQITEAQNRAKLTQMAETLSAEDALLKESGKGAEDEREKRAKTLKSGGKAFYKLAPKAAAVTSGSTVLPEHTASDIKPTFNELSSLVDRVKVVPLSGGESYQRAYLKGFGIGDYTAEGAEYSEDEPIFGYAEMTKAKITSYAEETEEVLKLPGADYDSVIGSGVVTAIKKKMNQEIMNGTGGANHLKGIFYNDTAAAKQVIDPATDLAVSAIDETTLDEIIYSYGGDEAVEDMAVLILNKKDLKAFATLRDADGDKVYDVVNRGNTGTIDGVPYVINSACKAISDSTTAADAYCMAYGPLSNYELPVFSDIETNRSTDYKFKQGQIAYKGVIFVGGGVAAHNGFIRVKKAAAAAPAGE